MGCCSGRLRSQDRPEFLRISYDTGHVSARLAQTLHRPQERPNLFRYARYALLMHSRASGATVLGAASVFTSGPVACRVTPITTES